MDIQINSEKRVNISSLRVYDDFELKCDCQKVGSFLMVEILSSLLWYCRLCSQRSCARRG